MLKRRVFDTIEHVFGVRRLREQFRAIDHLANWQQFMVVVHCAGGYRSSIAASLLERAGISGVRELAGGLAAREAAKLEVESAGNE